jgi:hypothetical protein
MHLKKNREHGLPFILRFQKPKAMIHIHNAVAPYGSKSCTRKYEHQRDGAYEPHVVGSLASKLWVTLIASCMRHSSW